jgi:hypothetical protein
VVNRTRSRRLLFALFVVLALAGVYGVAGLRHPAPASATKGGGRSAGQAAVTSALRACAEPGSAGVTAGSLAVASMPGSASGGSAVATRLVPGGSSNPGQAVATVTQPGVPHVVTVKAAPPLTKNLAAGQPGSTPQVTTTAGRGGLVVDATGAMAQGLEVEQTGPGGLVTAQCGTPGTSFWFVGPGQTSAADIQLYLMNTDGEAADAQVTLYTDVTKSGPLVGDADNSITVPPHSMVEQSLGRLLSSSKVVALNVTTSVGRVVPALRESRTNSDDGGWLPATLAPSTNLVIPGLPSRGGSPELFIAVPGTATAQVKVTAVTSRGSYQPTGGTGIDLLGGTATEIPLPALSGQLGAISISSSAPVVASMLVSGGPAGTPGALAASDAPVQEQGVIADTPAAGTDLVLSAPATAVSVRITVASATDPATAQTGTVVQVKARSSVVYVVKAPAGRRSQNVMVVVTPLAGSGPLYAGQVISAHGVVQSILPVPSSLTSVLLPPVQDSLTAVLP